MVYQRYLFFVWIIVLIISCKNSTKSETQSKDNSDSMFVPNDTSALFTWSLGCCEPKGIYNPKKYFKEELQATADIVFKMQIVLSTESTPFDVRDIDELNLDQLNKEYLVIMNQLKSFKTIPTTYFEELKTLRIRELEESYELKKIEIEAYTNPSVLLNNRFTEHCREYVTALTSNDSLLLVGWKKLTEEQINTSGDSVRYIKKFYKKFHSKDKLIYARIELMVYGFHKCANDLVYHYSSENRAQKEFEKLFRNFKIDCEGCD